MKTNDSTKVGLFTKEYLNSLFDYKDGKLFWKVARSSRIKVGDEACSEWGNGYLGVRVDHKSIALHRVVWMMFNDILPNYIDHIDGNKHNNRIENLRSATHTENNRNVGIKRHNTSGFKNVSWDKTRKKWVVHLSFYNKTKFIGRYEDLELAALVAEEVRNKYHGDFARHQ